MHWKVVHVDFPWQAPLLDNGYAVASVKLLYTTYGCMDIPVHVVVVRYSGFELCQHALVHCNNLNIWEVDSYDSRLGLLLTVNTRFLCDAV